MVILKMRYELEKENTKPDSINNSSKIRDEELQSQESFHYNNAAVDQ